MNEHTYWNRKGEEQAKYDEMQAADFPYTQASKSLFHSYYRYYNDGDLPGWARTRWDITKYTFDYWAYQASKSCWHICREGRKVSVLASMDGSDIAPERVAQFLLKADSDAQLKPRRAIW